MPKLLLVTQQAFYPDASGGSERSTAYLLEQLCLRNWQVEVICARRIRSPHFQKSFWRAISRFSIPFPAVPDQELGYPVWRLMEKFATQERWFHLLEKRLQQFQPDAVLGLVEPDCPLLSYSASKRLPCFYFARIVDPFQAGIRLPEGVNVIANSPFTASVLAQLTGKKAEVILPFVDQSRYQIRQRQRRYITFINPVPQKGLDVAIKIARAMPQKQFLFVKGNWSCYRGQEDWFLEPLYRLPNVDIWDHQSDARKIYELTDILLVPSQFDETFGRVILEAQMNGIPVVAAKVAGIPYTLGEGGILVEKIDNFQGYVHALDRLQNDTEFYKKISELAVINSQRQEFNPDFQVNQFVQFIERCLDRQPVSV